MAKKIVYGIGLLPATNRVVRVVKIDARRMLEIDRRVGRRLLPAVDGKSGPTPSVSDWKTESDKESIALCVRAITLDPVELIYKTVKRAPTADEVKVAVDAGQESPAEVEVKEPDLESTIGPLRDNPKDPRWTVVGEQSLTNEAEDNELSMFELFSDPADWKAVLFYIGSVGGGAKANPFAGQLLKTSASY